MCFTIAGCDGPRRIGRGSVIDKGEGDHYDDLKHGDQFAELGRAVIDCVVAPPSASSVAGITDTSDIVVNPASVYGVGWNAGVWNLVDPCRNARAQLDPKLDSGVLNGSSGESSRDVEQNPRRSVRGREFTSPSDSRPRTFSMRVRRYSFRVWPGHARHIDGAPTLR
jgi:hypothetical protein